MKHFGIWLVQQSAWLVNSGGDIFWTTSRNVAEAQLKVFRLQWNIKSINELRLTPLNKPYIPEASVREFEET